MKGKPVNILGKELETYGMEGNRRSWIVLAVLLGSTMTIAGPLGLLLHGIPLGFTIPLLNEPATLSEIWYLVVIIVIGLYIGAVGLWELVVERRFSVEFLMSVAAFGAAYLGFLFEAATVLFLYSLAEYFEGYIEDRARRTVEKLTQFMPDKARVMVNGSEKSMDVNEIQPGMVVLMRPSERIPLDGVVVGGGSTVDQSLVTGESAPVLKNAGDDVYAGTLNLTGVLKISVQKGAQDTLVSRITRLVVESRTRKASMEKLVDRFARFYIPVVIALAVFTAFVIPRLVGGPFDMWLYRSLILLVVSCPSAFVISVPATIFMAITIAAKKGVIVKGGVYIEKMAKVKAVIFDKTGTLTMGEPSVHNVNTAVEADSQALTYAAALEQYSHHPMAQAIISRAKERNLDFSRYVVKEINEVPGMGVTGYVGDAYVMVGNMELMKGRGCNCDQIEDIYENDSHMFICVSVDKAAIATICLYDEVRDDAVKTVRALKEADKHTAILTGDKTEFAKDVAERLGIDEAHAELFPEDKLRILDQIKAERGTIAMVGDGVNDAPALAAADVGVAMGGKGVDVALESADVVLVKDKLMGVPYLIKLSDRTVKIAKQNIASSLAIKILLGALGLMGFIPLWFTVASGDDGLTMLVLLNTLRLAKVGL
jgi:Cd2+/Zn2+-exporting ATPase